MNRKYRETFAQVRASDRLRAEVMDMTELERRPPKRGVPRAALIAAVLALVLAGTAIAAEALGLTVNFVTVLGWNEDGLLDSGYEILDAHTPIPEERLSQELLELAAGTGDGGRYLAFPTREEAEALWGLELLKNRRLNRPTLSVIELDGEAFSGDCVMHISCCGGKLMNTRLQTNYCVQLLDMPLMSVTLNTSLLTENALGTDYENGRSIGYFFNADPEDTVQTCEGYVTPGGLEAVIITSHVIPRLDPEARAEAEAEGAQIIEESRYTSAYFVRDDVLYELSVDDFVVDDGEGPHFLYTEEEVLGVLKQILDAYE